MGTLLPRDLVDDEVMASVMTMWRIDSASAHIQAAQVLLLHFFASSTLLMSLRRLAKVFVTSQRLHACGLTWFTVQHALRGILELVLE